MKVVRVHLATVDSTNAYARARLASFDQSAITMITADQQTSGKGRLGRVWQSTGEDITATFAFPVPQQSLPTAYQLSPLLSVVACRALGAHGVEARIKWPNDIIVSGCKKTGGILCEMESVAGQYWAALGLGLNVNSMPKDFGLERPIWPHTTLKAETGRVLSVSALTDALATELSAALLQFLSSGFTPFHSEYETRSVLLGKRIRFRDGARVVTGLASSIAHDGRLMVQEEAENGIAMLGSPTGFLSGEVSGVEVMPHEAMVEGVHDGKE